MFKFIILWGCDTQTIDMGCVLGRDWCLHRFSDLLFEMYYIKFGKESNYRVYKQSS